ncbi:arrestin domain-containing protein 17-like [Cloeon dipterum]|uniref:arrestin domain-containing protein 17-like n=1 Tax=Cloeon dipterum TaxID=197152 RepID=UPI00321FA6EE
MVLEVCQIIFDNPDLVYYAGHTISGKLLVSNGSTETAVRVIYIEIRGVGTVEWVVTKDMRKRNVRTNRYETRTVTTEHTNQETYVVEKIYVFQGGCDDALESGEHEFEFNIILPQDIPSSFESELGQIRYTISAIVETPWATDQEAIRTVTIVNPIDLNEGPQLAELISINKTRSFRSLFWTSGTVNVNLSLPVGGAVPGETLLPTLDIENLSRVHISNIEMSFKRRVVYKASDDTKKTVLKTITSKNLGHIHSRQSKMFQEEPVYIPVFLASNLKQCKIIDLDHFLEVNFIPPGFHFRFNVKLPVVLGTVPLRQSSDTGSQPTEPNYPPIGWNISSDPTLSASADEVPSYSDLPPPTYEESVFEGSAASAPGNDDEETED